jgi:hypothetical protein
VYSDDRQWRLTSKGWEPADPDRPRYGPNTKDVQSLFHRIFTLPEQELLKVARRAGDLHWRLQSEKAMVEAIDRAERVGMRYELVSAIDVAGSVGEAVTARYSMSPAPSFASARKGASKIMPVSLAILSATVALVTRDFLTDAGFALLYGPMMPVGETGPQSDHSNTGPSNRWVG